MEYYAKLVYSEKGLFRVVVSIWRTNSDTKIESLVDSKKFVRYAKAKKWAEKRIIEKYFLNNSNAFLREKDVIRRKWDE